ncbi:hypothetical protein DDE82_001471 [Stemphylium lycopersici]|uniref:Uncharacterized protein n=1 Tax=Stemphylium lycopersici TaxID=183478 RepID=A0A364NGY5_STELY|nr:hypothetical protein TW65_08353 [Stemphylium lycopersici]RAR09754.1 hypothetical protein DDE82_001471 [Stemphylium lycopersici]RAR16530.1 hypothetical protein DDE83_000095 [Stemphylium lycopersici]
MPGFLDLPLELRNHVYEALLGEELERSFRGVMVVSEHYLCINVDLRTREPLRDGPRESFVPHEHELAHLLEHSPTCFAKQLFDYIAIFLKTLANLLFQGNPRFSVLYTENMTLNLRTPTKVVALGGSGHNPITLSRRLRVDQAEAHRLFAFCYRRRGLG